MVRALGEWLRAIIAVRLPWFPGNRGERTLLDFASQKHSNAVHLDGGLYR